MMLRRLLIILLFAALAPGTWIRSEPPAQDMRSRLDLKVISLPPHCCTAGPLQLLGAWKLSSENTAFGGYSALISTAPGALLALSDRGYFLRFAKPGGVPAVAQFGSTQPDSEKSKASRDVEAAAWDPLKRRLWLALERRNAVARYHGDMIREAVRPMPEWRDWPGNYGPETMVRLADGRFIVLCECRPSWFGEYRHPGYLYPGDPISSGTGIAFTFAGADGYRPTDAAELPDGRVLVLMRRLVWPVPARFAIKVVLADPAEIAAGKVWRGREIAEIAAPWPVDNYEGLTIERGADGQLVAWIISDDNGAASQRTLLLKVSIDEARLPQKQKAPG